MENHYYNLCIGNNASLQEIKDAHRKLALVCHPDKNQNSNCAIAAEEMFKRIQKAYEILSNPITKAKHDEDLRKEQIDVLKAKKLLSGNKFFHIRYEAEITDIFTKNEKNFQDTLNAVIAAKNPNVLWWFKYMEGSYIIVTKNKTTAQNLSSVFMKLIPKKIHLVLEVNISNYYGYLNQNVINWMKQVAESYNAA